MGALLASLSAQCTQYAGNWESWSTVAMRRWLHAASVVEHMVLRRLLQVADNDAVNEVLHRLQDLEIYRVLCSAYSQVVIAGGISISDGRGGKPAVFPELVVNSSERRLWDGKNSLGSQELSLDTCGELWVLLLLLLPEHLRSAVAVELAGPLVASSVSATIR